MDRWAPRNTPHSARPARGPEGVLDGGEHARVVEAAHREREGPVPVVHDRLPKIPSVHALSTREALRTKNMSVKANSKRMRGNAMRTGSR